MSAVCEALRFVTAALLGLLGWGPAILPSGRLPQDAGLQDISCSETCP